MKKIILIILFYLFNTSHISSNELKLYESIKGLNTPWSLSFIEEHKVLVTEKSGNIILVDLKKKILKK